MSRWIAFQDKQPQDGQLVVLLYDPSRAPICERSMTVVRWIIDSHVGAMLITHWLPIPPLTNNLNQEHLRAEHPHLWAASRVLEKKLRERAPRINWEVEPYLSGTDEVGWLIKGRVEVGDGEIGGDVVIRFEMMESKTMDWIGYVVHQMERFISEELWKA